MKKVNVHQAKTHLSRLVEDAAGGDEVVIAKSGKPVARLVAIAPPPRVKKKGLLKGKISIKKSFYAALPDVVLDDFEGKSR